MNAQGYFPGLSNNQWDSTSATELSWCQPNIDSLYSFLDSSNSKSFILIKDGKIVLEKYFDGHSDTSNWYWASAGKTLTSFLVGIAQEEGFLNISDTSSKYLGNNWSSAGSSKESLISIKDHLSMTSGLNDSNNPDCTDDTCMLYLADAGTRWAYRNAPYTLLDEVIRSSTGRSLNLYLNQKLKTLIGMDGLFLPLGYNNVYWSTSRSMARFGLLMLNNGVWDGTTVMQDSIYFNEMIETSQSLNLSYGYLWWLNGKSSFMLPQSQFVFPGMLCPDAPADMFAAMGKNGQLINVIPSLNMVWIRMGDSPDNLLVPANLNNDIWKHINMLECDQTGQKEELDSFSFHVYPNPSSGAFNINFDSTPSSLDLSIYNLQGQRLFEQNFQNRASISFNPNLASGHYILELKTGSQAKHVSIVIQQPQRGFMGAPLG